MNSVGVRGEGGNKKELLSLTKLLQICKCRYTLNPPSQLSRLAFFMKGGARGQCTLLKVALPPAVCLVCLGCPFSFIRTSNIASVLCACRVFHTGFFCGGRSLWGIATALCMSMRLYKFSSVLRGGGGWGVGILAPLCMKP